jgi:hypothetical protein
VNGDAASLLDGDASAELDVATTLVLDAEFAGLDAMMVEVTATVPPGSLTVPLDAVKVADISWSVELGVREISAGRDCTKVVLLYGAIPLDTTCATLFANRMAVSTFIRVIPSLEFLELTVVHDPFWYVKPEQPSMPEHISEQDAKSLTAKLEVMLLLVGKTVLQRISYTDPEVSTSRVPSAPGQI